MIIDRQRGDCGGFEDRKKSVDPQREKRDGEKLKKNFKSCRICIEIKKLDNLLLFELAKKESDLFEKVRNNVLAFPSCSNLAFRVISRALLCDSFF